MPGYCQTSDLVVSFSQDEVDQVGDRSNDGVHTADSPVVQAAIDQARSQMDAYLAVVLDLATLAAPYPPMLVTLNVDLARYRLYNDAPPPQVVERYKDALATLEQVRRGDLIVVGADGSDLSTRSRAPFFQFNPKRFTRKTMRGY